MLAGAIGLETLTTTSWLGTPSSDGTSSRFSVKVRPVNVAGTWRYVYRAVEARGRVIDVFVSPHRNIVSPRRSRSGVTPSSRI